QTPGYGDLLSSFYTSDPRMVVDGFATNSSALPSNATAVLDEVVRRLQREYEHAVILSGAATADENNPTSLSRERAEAGRTYLTDRGIDPSVITIEAFGVAFTREHPSIAGSNEANRRVQITLVG